MINWRVRIKNKQFWLAVIPAAFLLVQAILKVFGVEFDFTGIQNNLINVANALFALLAILGIVVDPTTDGVADSELAMTYVEPKK